MRWPQAYSGSCGPGTFVQTMWKRGMGVLSQPKLPARNACTDRKSTRLNSSHLGVAYAVFCLKHMEAMRQASRDGKGQPLFSPQRKEAITQRLERGEQTILFLNRRGYSTSLKCPKCGYVAECPNCSVSLTYHRIDQKLSCHICGHSEKVPAVCPEPKCKNPAIRFAGTGTQKVEEILAKLFPKARVKRMDADTMKRKDDYRHVLGDFRAGKIDILVGTQMIAKGLHFPNVTLVGIIYADMALHQPDFRVN